MKKRILAVLLCMATIFSVAACGNGNKNNTEGGVQVTEPTLKKLATFDNLEEVFKGDYEVTDKVMAEGFASLLTNVGVGVEWVKVTDRDTVEEGDIVNIDYTGYLDDKPFDGGAAKDQWINVKNNCAVDELTAADSTGFIDGFTKGLVGAKVGETVKHDVTFPENYGSTELAGKLTTFEFKINGIYTYKTHTLETINDEFVVKNFKETYELSTVEELKAYVKETLTYSALFSYIVDNSEYDIADDYVEFRLDTFVKYQEETLKSMYGDSMTLDTYLAYVYGSTLKEIRPSWKEVIKSQIEFELIYEGLVKEYKLELDEKAAEEYILSNLGDKATDADVEDYYKYVGAGVAEKGKAYIINQTAVKELLMTKLGFEEAK